MFGLPEKIIVFDTEYTTWEGAMGRDWSGLNEHREIVQIGAVKVETENFEELGSFSVCVKPKINPKLSDFFTKLTGITQEVVDKKGVSFPEALERFVQWVGEMPLYSWGSGDLEALLENCELLNIPFPFDVSRFSDARHVFQGCGIPAENYMSSTIVEAFGKKPARRGHNALNDARAILDALRELKSSSASPK